MTEILVYANRIALDAVPPARVLVVPWGYVKSKNHDFVVDREAADAMVAALTAHGTDLPIDFEHTTMGGEFASPDGSAPAMGWIKALSIEEGVGIWADVEWTERGANFIAKKEYRYLSPVVLVRKSDSRAVGLHSVGLTNKPAIVGMAPIANKEAIVVNSEEVLQQARWFLNLPTTATEQDIMNELEKLLGQIRTLAGVDATANAETALTALKAKLDDASKIRVAACKALKLAERATADDIVAAVNKAVEPNLAANSELQVISNRLKETTEELNTMKKRMSDGDIQARIDKAFSDGKLCKAQITANSEQLREMASDEKRWNAFVDVLPVQHPTDGRVVANNTKPAGGTDRASVIKAANSEYTSESDIHELCSREAFVSDALVRAGHSDTLSDDDKKLLVC
ncbi:MAG: hypothetical protein H6819_06735 [Phycisphaerales bacterium]|nr:hypothetical protein [Phycisphaerales bacterium]MCB9855277.1 hypothetical protein [Phycisphaerales bacterium]MCB9862870.1 hypothetical protein [Phycisphaerales bacterium]